MDFLFLILILILCVLVAYFVKARTKGGFKWFGRSEVTGSSEEIEARWLDIDIDDMRNKIEELGGELVHDEKQYRRYVFGLDSDTNDVEVDGNTMTIDDLELQTKNSEKECKDFVKAVKSKGDGYVRIREEYCGDDIVITMTCKLYPKSTKHADEYELTIDGSLDDGKAFLDALGVKQKAYHETRRIKYKVTSGELKGIHELVLDTIPGMPPYIEIEAKSEKDMFTAAKALGLDKGDEHYGPYGKTFADIYGFTQSWFDNFEGDGLNELTFATFAEAMMPHITKNKDMFEKAVKMFGVSSDVEKEPEELEKLEVVDDTEESDENAEESEE